MNKKFAIGIPTINQGKELEHRLKFYVEDFPNTEIFILDNGWQKIVPPTHRFEGQIKIDNVSENLGVARSWNYLLKKIFAHHFYALILNDDVYLGRDEYDIRDLLQTKADLYTAEHNFDCFSAFILPRETYSEVGGFDDNYKYAYYEDSDYLRTLTVQHGKSVLHSPVLNPVIFNRGSSFAANPALKAGHAENERYYITKWGNPIGAELYKTPFNK